MLKEFFKNVKIKRLKKKILRLKKEECYRKHWGKVYKNKYENCNTCGCIYTNNSNPDEIIAKQARLEINFLEEELKEICQQQKEI